MSSFPEVYFPVELHCLDLEKDQLPKQDIDLLKSRFPNLVIDEDRDWGR